MRAGPLTPPGGDVAGKLSYRKRYREFLPRDCGANLTASADLKNSWSKTMLISLWNLRMKFCGA